MANVYSKLLFESHNPPAVTEVVYNVPSGYVTVVRSIVAFASYSPGTIISGFQLSTHTNSVPLLVTVTPYFLPSRSYQWEMRQVLEPGDGLVLTPLNSALAIRVSGFELTLP